MRNGIKGASELQNGHVSLDPPVKGADEVGLGEEESSASHKSGVAETHVVVRWGGYGPLGAAVYDYTHSAPVTCSTPH